MTLFTPKILPVPPGATVAGTQIASQRATAAQAQITGAASNTQAQANMQRSRLAEAPKGPDTMHRVEHTMGVAALDALAEPHAQHHKDQEDPLAAILGRRQKGQGHPDGHGHNSDEHHPPQMPEDAFEKTQ